MIVTEIDELVGLAQYLGDVLVIWCSWNKKEGSKELFKLLTLCSSKPRQRLFTSVWVNYCLIWSGSWGRSMEVLGCVRVDGVVGGDQISFACTLGHKFSIPRRWWLHWVVIVGAGRQSFEHLWFHNVIPLPLLIHWFQSSILTCLGVNVCDLFKFVVVFRQLHILGCRDQCFVCSLCFIKGLNDFTLLVAFRSHSVHQRWKLISVVRVVVDLDNHPIHRIPLWWRVLWMASTKIFRCTNSFEPSSWNILSDFKFFALLTFSRFLNQKFLDICVAT